MSCKPTHAFVAEGHMLRYTHARKLWFQCHEYCQKQKFAGIGPDFEHSTEQRGDTDQEKNAVRDILISAYDKNISTGLKAELCSSEVSNYNCTKDASMSKFPFFSPSLR